MEWPPKWFPITPLDIKAVKLLNKRNRFVLSERHNFVSGGLVKLLVPIFFI
jgi:hypothetical protein